MVSRWVKFAAVFLLAFTLMDVTLPEVCADELPASTSSTLRFQSGSSSSDSGTGECAFEEDCIACANILPASPFVLTSLTLVAKADAISYVSALDGPTSSPYHPPRF